jgi:hypothetical protein
VNLPSEEKTQQFVRFFDFWLHIFLTVEEHAVRIAGLRTWTSPIQVIGPNSASKLRKAHFAATSCYPVCPKEGVR